MVAGIGIDVVATSRIARSLAADDAFFARVFTASELAACIDRADRAQALAARFAAKEACLKALGTGWGRGIGLRDVEVRTSPDGRPELALSGQAAARAKELQVRRMHVTLTHEADVAAAVVVLEAGAVSPPE